MFASIFIILVSVLLFLYWFRYTCLLILSARTTTDYASQVVSANQLSFPEAKARLLDEADSAQLDPLHHALDRDYRLLTYLLRNAENYHLGPSTIEQRILMVDFQLMKFWYWITRSGSPGHAREALLEMVSIVDHLANVMGERLALSTRT